MALRDKLLKNTTIKKTATLQNSMVYGPQHVVPTKIPMLNVAFSGSVTGGIVPGLTMFAGPSKHFKTGFSLTCGKAFLDAHDDGIILFYDSEFGTPQGYFDTFGIDPQKVVHSPITDIEQLKFDIMQQLDGIEESDHIMIIVDSVGNLASKKEVDDAMDGKAVADMTRAKQMKSLWRLVTPHLTLKGVPMIAVNHTYKEIGLYPKDIVSGGTGGIYSADNIFILGRQQDKNKSDPDIKGYHFIINVEKSRFTKEKSKIPILVSWDGGINRWSGLLEQALEHGSVTKTKPGYYMVTTPETKFTKELREKDITLNGGLWREVLADTDLAAFIQKKFGIASGSIMHDEDTE